MEYGRQERREGELLGRERCGEAAGHRRDTDSLVNRRRGDRKVRNALDQRQDKEHKRKRAAGDFSSAAALPVSDVHL